jgi:hypothetical protein
MKTKKTTVIVLLSVITISGIELIAASTNEKIAFPYINNVGGTNMQDNPKDTAKHRVKKHKLNADSVIRNKKDTVTAAHK